VITFVKNGDLFACGATVLVNAANCVGVMGGGIALAFKQRFPAMYDDYKAACAQGRVGVNGKLHLWSDGSLFVVNLATKYRPEQPSTYLAVERGAMSLRLLIDVLWGHPDVKVAVPALGCGLGGLEWGHVKPVLIRAFSGARAEVLIFEPH
jgi:O-acetyl-ADP-ribose deacetylase (regulator of RNase III)